MLASHTYSPLEATLARPPSAVPRTDVVGTVHSRLSAELVALVGPTGPGISGVMQLRQESPSRVQALVYLKGGRHAVITWNAEHATRTLHGTGDAGYLDALDEFCALADIPPLDSRLARRRAQAAAALEAQT